MDKPVQVGISISVDERLHDLLTTEARRRGITLSALIVEILQSSVKKKSSMLKFVRREDWSTPG